MRKADPWNVDKLKRIVYKKLLAEKNDPLDWVKEGMNPTQVMLKAESRLRGVSNKEFEELTRKYDGDDE
jgi:hypothetical protein